MSNVLITLQQVLILIIEIGVGYYFAKKGKIPASALGVLMFLCTTIALPCAIIYPVINLENTPEVWKNLSFGLLIILVVALIQVAVSVFLFRNAPEDKRATYQIATVYGNSAFMGIPLVSAILGGDAVIYATLMVIFDTVFLFAHCAIRMSGERPTLNFIVKKIFGLATISLLIGIAILISGIQLPMIVTTVLVDLKGMMTPVAMLIVGTQLAQQDFKEIFNKPTHYVVAVIKLLVWPLVILFALSAFKSVLPSMAVIAILICKGTPQAAVLGVLAGNYNQDGKAAASVVGLTTILSIITLPIVAALAQMMFG